MHYFKQKIKGNESSQPKLPSNVFSKSRYLIQPKFISIQGLKLDKRQKMDGLKMLRMLSENSIPLIFFDPQYRSILDKQCYGNEGTGMLKNRSQLPQMSDEMIRSFLKEIERVLMPSGHVMV